MGYGLICAADVELILGTSSAFNVVRGTTVTGGTSTIYVGSATVSIGTTTQSAMLTIAGSSTDTTSGLRVTNSSGTVTLNVRNDGAVFIGTNTSTLNSALYVGSATSGSLGTITAGFLSMGTISANAGLHGTTTVRFLNDIFANGTITAAKFSGDGSGLSGITATGGVTSGNISTSGTISAGSTTVSTLTTTGSITAASGGFVVDTTGSMTATTITSTGLVTASFLSLTGSITAANGSFTVSSTGSMTVSRLAVGTTDYSLGKLAVVGNASDVQVRVRANSSQNTDIFLIETSGGTDIFTLDKDGKVEIKPTGNAGPMLIDGGNVNGLGLLDLKSFDRSTISSNKGVFSVRSTPSSTITGDIKLIQLISSTTLTTGSITALNIDNITAGAGTETAISIGSGWDTDLAFVDTSPTIKIGNGGALSFTDGSNILLYLSDNGTTGFLGVGTTTPSTALHVIGTVTATGFIGDGSQLTGVSATSVSANVVDSNQLVNTLNITDTTINVGSLTVSAGNFRVDSAGSMTATTINTGTATVTGTLTAASNNFVVGSTGSMTASSITVSTGTLTVASGAFKVDETGSMTAARITVSSGTVTAKFLSVGTVSTSADGTTTVRFLNDIFANGTITASKFSGDGSQLTGVSATSVGANAVDSNQLVNTLNITDTTINVGSLTVSAGNFRVDSTGSTTVSTLTTTGSATVNNTFKVAPTSASISGTTNSADFQLGVSGLAAAANWRGVNIDAAISGSSDGNSTGLRISHTLAATHGVSDILKGIELTFGAIDDNGDAIGIELIQPSTIGGFSSVVDTYLRLTKQGGSLASGGEFIDISSGSDSDVGLRMGATDISGTTVAIDFTSFDVDGNGSMTASALSITGTATVATTSGNVGIGTTTPQHKLSVVNGSIYSVRSALSDPGANGTITVNWNNSNVQSVAFSNANGNRDIVFTNGQDGGKYILFLKQGSSATSTVSWPATSTVRWSGGGAGTTLTGTVSKTDYFGFIYNGIDSVYDAVAERLNF